MTSTLDRSTTAGARASERLDTERIGWLTTTNPDGQPQSSPIWFLWTGDVVLLFSGIRAPRNENVAERPRVAFNLNSNVTGGDVVTMEGEAMVDLTHPAAYEVAAYVEKYRDLMAESGWTPESFSGDYPLPILVHPTRWRVG